MKKAGKKSVTVLELLEEVRRIRLSIGQMNAILADLADVIRIVNDKENHQSGDKSENILQKRLDELAREHGVKRR